MTAVREAIGDGSLPRSIVAALADKFPEADVRTAIWDLIEQGAAEITGDRKVKLRATPVIGTASRVDPTATGAGSQRSDLDAVLVAARAAMAAHKAHTKKTLEWAAAIRAGQGINLPDFADEVAEIHRTLRELDRALESHRRTP